MYGAQKGKKMGSKNKASGKDYSVRQISPSETRGRGPKTTKHKKDGKSPGY